MCGIAAISLSPGSTLPARHLAHQLLLHSEERGKIASGYGFSHGGKTLYHKDATPGGHLKLEDLPKDARTVITHTRNATVGDPDDQTNNHPVLDPSNRIVLVHNGVVTNHEAIRDIEKEVPFAEVDSSVIPWLVAEQGTEGLQHIDGWAALAWLDIRTPDVIHLARTTGNSPMIVAELKDGSRVMASTFQILHAALIDVGHKDSIVGGWEVPDHTYLTLRKGQITNIGNLTPFNKVSGKYRPKAAMSWQEKQRLEKITAGDAVDYSDKNPVHAPVKTVTTPATVAPAYKPPATGAVASGKVYEPPLPKVERKPGENPFDTIKRVAASIPDRPRHTVTYGAPSGHYGTSGATHNRSKASGYSSYYDRLVSTEDHSIRPELEQRLRYWVTWAGTSNEPDLKYDEDIFSPIDFEDEGYLWESFLTLVWDGFHKGDYIDDFGIRGIKGGHVSLKTMSERGMINTAAGIARGLPEGSPRTIPEPVTSQADDTMQDGEERKSLLAMTDEEWEVWARG